MEYVVHVVLGWLLCDISCVVQCDKIKRRRASLFGTFHLANSSALEEAGLQITRAVYV